MIKKAKISFNDKVTLNQNTSIPDENKVTADDMNEIKEVVNANDDNIGDLSNLNTTNKDSIVSAVNDVYGDVSILKSGQKILWSGGFFMQEGQRASLSENISAQKNGIVLVWSGYSSNQVQDYHWHFFYIPKKFVELKNGNGVSCFLHDATFVNVGSKYVYVNDNSIVGNENNNSTGAHSGITYQNNKFVLRYVIGV